MFQPKDTNWLNGYKNKTHIYAVYKKPTSDLKTHRLKEFSTPKPASQQILKELL